ncbi:UNVERIFIED_CONTAM: hypothetical protein FKN15_030456 [Acipenser sinensis]
MREKAVQLVAALEGEAQRTLLDLTEIELGQYQAVVMALDHRFGGPTPATALRQRLASRVGRSGEKLGVFAAEIRYLLWSVKFLFQDNAVDYSFRGKMFMKIEFPVARHINSYDHTAEDITVCVINQCYGTNVAQKQKKPEKKEIHDSSTGVWLCHVFPLSRLRRLSQPARSVRLA